MADNDETLEQWQARMREAAAVGHKDRLESGGIGLANDGRTLNIGARPNQRPPKIPITIIPSDDDDISDLDDYDYLFPEAFPNAKPPTDE